MLELLSQLGLPVAVVLAIAVVGIISYTLYNYWLDNRKQEYAAKVKINQDIQSRLFESLTKAGQYISEYYHYVNHVKDGDSKYKSGVEKQYKLLRSFARENVILLGEDFEKAIYAFTDAGKQVITTNFDEGQFWKTYGKVRDMRQHLLNTIPGVPKVITKKK